MTRSSVSGTPCAARPGPGRRRSTRSSATCGRRASPRCPSRSASTSRAARSSPSCRARSGPTRWSPSCGPTRCSSASRGCCARSTTPRRASSGDALAVAGAPAVRGHLPQRLLPVQPPLRGHRADRRDRLRSRLARARAPGTWGRRRTASSRSPTPRTRTRPWSQRDEQARRLALFCEAYDGRGVTDTFAAALGHLRELIGFIVAARRRGRSGPAGRARPRRRRHLRARPRLSVRRGAVPHVGRSGRAGARAASATTSSTCPAGPSATARAARGR